MLGRYGVIALRVLISTFAHLKRTDCPHLSARLRLVAGYKHCKSLAEGMDIRMRSENEDAFSDFESIVKEAS